MEIKKLLKIFEVSVGSRAVAATAQASGIADPNKIRPGQQIKIPMQDGGYVMSTVKPGDTLSGMISRAQNTQSAKAALAPKVAAANPNQAAVDAANAVQAGQKAVVTAPDKPVVQTNALGIAPQTNIPNSPTATSADVTEPESNGAFQSGGYGSVGTSGHSADNKKVFGATNEEETEEDLAEMLRLSGMTMNEKAPPTAKGERMVKHIKKGYSKDGKLTDKEKSIAYATAWKSHNKAKVSESVMLEAGNNLEHIITRFKHETKNFLNGNQLDDDLYNALYDYYVDNGEMPYTVAKAKQGQDPYQWVERHFEDALAMMGHMRQFQETAMPVIDGQLSELARLAGLSESRVDECGDMGMDQEGRMNISTNMSSDGTKSVTISAQGDEAESLIQMLKLAGMGHMGHDSHSEEPVVMVSGDDDEMMEESGGIQVHDLSGMDDGSAYDETQVSDEIHDGDVLITRNGVGVMVGAWPVIVAGSSKEFHKLKTGVSWDEFEGGKYANSARKAMEVAGGNLDEEYANEPDEEYHSIDSITTQGNDLNRQKRQYADRPKLGDNPMAEELSLDEELQGLLDSVLVKADEGSIKGGDRPGDLTGTWSADPPKKGQPDIPPPVPMDPVSPAAPTAPRTPTSPSIPKPGIKK